MDAEAAYIIGVIDWTQAYMNVHKALSSIGLQDDGLCNARAPVNVLRAIRDQNSALVYEPLKYLNQAVQNRPDYFDAMAYMNLVYRRKADLDFDNLKARINDVSKADEWSRKAMETRKPKEE